MSCARERGIIVVLLAALGWMTLLWCQADSRADAYEEGAAMKAKLSRKPPEPVAVNQRAAETTAQIIGASQEKPRVFEARVDVVRLHIADIVRRRAESPACPAPTPAPTGDVPATPAAGHDDPGRPADPARTNDAGVSLAEHREVKRRLRWAHGHIRELWLARGVVLPADYHKTGRVQIVRAK